MEVKEVPGTAEPRIVPLKHSQTGEGKQFDVEHLISQVILFSFPFKSVQPDSQFWTCCSACSNLVTADLRQRSFIFLYQLFLEVTDIIALPALGFNLFGRISSDICFCLIISDKTWKVRL